MNWRNVKLVFLREVRDQLRDRRTLFMIAVLPVLLYPLMGMSFLQMMQFMQEQPSKVLFIGSEALPASPPLLADAPERFVADLFSSQSARDLLQLTVETAAPVDLAAIEEDVRRRLDQGKYDAVIVFPADFAHRLKAYRDQTSEQRVKPPEPQVFFHGARDSSRAAYGRINNVLTRWRSQLVKKTLDEHRVPATAATPFQISDHDVSGAVLRRAAIWSKVLPFAMIVWALTGAFYPAIDLCAGEKERGTLETLLCSPAQRVEIVWGKLLTVILFSIATAVLNLFSMAATSGLMLQQMQSAGSFAAGLRFGPPPWQTVGWLLLALVPLACLFSALAMALAAMARSSKEGQYYLMPLLLVTFPLAMLPMMPNGQTTLGTSLIPLTGVMMLLRALIEAEYWLALKLVLPVAVVTGLCCALAIRWAVHQFNDESVLFRDSERFSLRVWLRHLIRDRQDTPAVSQALFAGIVLLLLQFFVRLTMPMPQGFGQFAWMNVAIQIGLIAVPAIMLSLLLTRSPSRTLLLKIPRANVMAVAVVLAIVFHPAASVVREAIQFLYPISDQTFSQLSALSEFMQGVPLWQVILLMAVTPAICEELAFRGFLLSGLKNLGSRPMAILISSLLFGIAHGMLQQSINATLLGVLLGYLAVQTGSLLPCIGFHVTHNSLQLLAASLFTPQSLQQYPWSRVLLKESTQLPGAVTYSWPVVLISLLSSMLILMWLARQRVVMMSERSGSGNADRLESEPEATSERPPSRVYPSFGQSVSEILP